jgi:hypothetical protein
MPPKPTIKGAGIDKVTIDIPNRFIPPPGLEIWVAPDGKDRGQGTFSRPFKTLQYAFERSEPVVCCMPGRYEPSRLSHSQKTIVAPYGNVVIATPGPDIARCEFRRSNTPGVYVTTMPRTMAPRAILYRTEFDQYGHEQRMLSGPDGWQYDEQESELRIRFANANEQRHFLRALYVNPYNRGSVFEVNNASLAVGTGVAFEGVEIRAKSSMVILDQCALNFASGNGLSMLGGTSFLSHVRAHAAQSDCFNYGHDDDGHPSFAIEYNCHASHAGDTSTYGTTLPNGGARDNLNGSSSHSSMIVRYGGLYEGSLGADIADTWSNDTPDQVSINYGVLTSSSKIGLGYIFAGGDGNPTAYLNRCASEGQTIDILAANSANVMCFESDLPKTKLANGGTIGSYPG